jgi:4-amino-4-deoxy-L-arabinose transferase-like glycosyltransferase
MRDGTTVRPARTIPIIAAVAVFLIHLVGNPHYGFFRDELYFIICGFHPQFGYVDQPPLVPLLSAMTQLFGHSLVLLRAVPALFAAAGVYTTCLLVVELGGGAFAQVLASVVFFFANVLMSFGMKVSADEVGLWTWPLIALFVVRLTKGADPRLWLAVGAIAGLSLESKYSVLFYLAALIVGLLLVPERRVLFSRWFALGAAVAIVIALPSFLWQWQHGFPMLELLKNGQNGKNLIVGPIAYLGQEIIITGLLLAVVWMIGLVWLLRTGSVRFLGATYILLIAEMMIFHGKHYYPADIYPVLIAAGALAIESWTRTRRAARSAVTAVAVIVGAALLPMTLPVLPESTFVSYSAALGNALHLSRSAVATEGNRETSALPGDWADMHGWTELAAAVTKVYDSLPPAERAQAVVFAGNYGEASAVAFFSPQIPVISEHNQYWLWGTRGYSGNVLIQIGGSCFHSDGYFASRTLATTFTNRWAINYENDVPIWICRGIKKPLAAIWPEIKTYE